MRDQVRDVLALHGVDLAGVADQAVQHLGRDGLLGIVADALEGLHVGLHDQPVGAVGRGGQAAKGT